MAINKVINDRSHKHGALRNVIEYVLRDDKVREVLVFVTGPYAPETVTWDGVYRAFLDEKKLWDKDSGRMYSHMIVSFHKDEKITPEECLEFGRALIEDNFPDFQSVVGVHQDRDHLHLHCVINTVSFIDGHKLHTSKRDLEALKERTNRMCRERGLTVAEKGKHFDGTVIEAGEVTAWEKNKYKLLQNESRKSFVADCGLAVMEVMEDCADRDEFIREMGARGWRVTWTENRKHITFENENGNKVRDSNLSKTFAMDIGKETLSHEFERQKRKRERIAVERTAEAERAAELDRDATAERERQERELAEYYAEIERAVAGADDAIQDAGTDKAYAGAVSHHTGAERDHLRQKREDRQAYGGESDAELKKLRALAGASGRAREDREIEQQRLRAEESRREREEREEAERRRAYYFISRRDKGIDR